VVSSFATAKQYLDEQPAVLISEVRLGEYNGLHLALRAQGRGVPAVLIGEPDSVLQREATQLGATYLAGVLDAQRLLSVIQPLTETAAASGRTWALTAAANVSFVSFSERTRQSRHLNPFRS
jgi:FixJ family two-component response regulator